MQLPKIPTTMTKTTTKTSNHHSIPQQQARKRRLLPQIDTATYTKKIADLKSSPDTGILPVGYPVFTDDDLQPSPEIDPQDLGAPLKQSPASALPPLLPEMDAETKSIREDDYEPINPDIHRPSPPRAGAARLFENPFELTDEDSAPVEPKKLTPSHIFESASLEESLLLMEAAEKAVVGRSPASYSEQDFTSAMVRSFDPRTFVIRRSSPASLACSSNESKPSTPSQDPIEAIDLPDNDGLPVGAEASEAGLVGDEVAMEMDYDNLMAYFENLKESTA